MLILLGLAGVVLTAIMILIEYNDINTIKRQEIWDDISCEDKWNLHYAVTPCVNIIVITMFIGEFIILSRHDISRSIYILPAASILILLLMKGILHFFTIGDKYSCSDDCMYENEFKISHDTYSEERDKIEEFFVCVMLAINIFELLACIDLVEIISPILILS